MQKYLQKQARTPQPQQDKDEAAADAAADEDPEKQQATQEAANRDATQQLHQNPRQQPDKQAQTTKPTAAKTKPPTRNTEACQQPPHLPPPQESNSSSSHETPAPSHIHHHTHFVTILGHEPPFTALQHGLPVLRDLLSYQVRAQASIQQPPQHMAPPPIPPPTYEELQLSYQIAQALTTQIQRITARILQTNAVGQPNRTHHHNDVITIDSQKSESHAELDAQPQQGSSQQQQQHSSQAETQHGQCQHSTRESKNNK